MKKRAFPNWWHWELEWTPHLLKRMEDRQFNEVDLREMLQHTKNYRKVLSRVAGSSRPGMTAIPGTSLSNQTKLMAFWS
jgi:hypothetical protein